MSLTDELMRNDRPKGTVYYIIVLEKYMDEERWLKRLIRSFHNHIDKLSTKRNRKS